MHRGARHIAVFMALVKRADTHLRTRCKTPPTTLRAPAGTAGALSTRHAWQTALSRVAEKAETPRRKLPGVSRVAGGRRTNSKLGRRTHRTQASFRAASLSDT